MDNSRYRRLDEGAPVRENSNPLRSNNNTIRTNAGSSIYDNYNNYDNSGMDIMEADAHQKSLQAKRVSAARGHSGRGAARNRKQTIIYSVIIAIEIVILAAIWIIYAVFSSGSGSSSSDKSASSAQESSQNSGGSVNVNNDNFQLTCTKVSITTDTAGNPAAVIYFTFVNKTDNSLSMAEVFSPIISQNGSTLSPAGELTNNPQEIVNTSTQVSNGQSIECAVAVSLQDSTSELTLTMHDNYETFSDIGSTVVPIS